MIEPLRLFEFVDKSKLHNLITSGLVSNVEWTQEDKNKKHKWFNTKNYQCELQSLEHYYNSLNSIGLTQITYTNETGIGRYKLPNCLSSMKRIYRNYLLCDDYYDFDMVNSCSTILLNLASKHNSKNMRCLKSYVNNRQKWFDKIKKEFKCDNKQSKNIMTALTFGANLTFKDDELTAYKNSLRFIQTELQETNLYNFIQTEKSGLSWLAKLIQHIEKNIVVGLLKHIINNYPQLVFFTIPFEEQHSIENIILAIYELDGFKLLKKNVDDFGGSNAIIGIINEWLIQNSYNYISFINKSMDEKIDLSIPSIPSIPTTPIINEISPIQLPSQINIEIVNDQAKSKKPKKNKEIEIIPMNILYLGSNDLARYIAPNLSKIMKYSRRMELWIIFNERTNFWEKVKKPEATLSTYLQRSLNLTRIYLVNTQHENLVNRNQSDVEIERDLKTCDNWYAKSSEKSHLSIIKDFLTTYIYDDDFIEKLDNNLYQLVFQNGILDLKTMIFRNGLLKEDYLTKCIPYDYVKPSNDDILKVRKELLKICNNNESHLEYYLSLIGYSLTGDSSKEQIFAYFRGQSASNGKSVILEVLEDIMPNYVKKAENKIFDISFDMKKELPSFQGKRIIWVNELSKSKKESDRLKAFADGTTYSFGRNYAIESEILNVLFKMIIVSNYSINIDADNGIKRRFKLAQFNSKFDELFTEDNYEKLEFKKNKNFGNSLRNELKLALIQLLAQYGNYYWNEKTLKPYPNEWYEEAVENMNENNKFDEWFNDNFTFDLSEIKEGEKGLFIGKQIMIDMLPSSLQNIKINDELKRMRLNFTYDKARRYNSSRGCYVGFGLKKQEENEY
jgi:hypothetical protein